MSRYSRSKRRRRAREAREVARLPVPEARIVVLDTDCDPLDLIFAANSLCADPLSESVSVDDLLQCVQRGGVAAEMGARALNIRLGRKTDEQITPEDIIVDPSFWRRYIAGRG